MIIAGIDYSMTSPAIAVYDTAKPLVFQNIQLFNLNKTKKYQGVHGNILIEGFFEHDSPEDRYRQIAHWAISILQKNQVKSAVLEGYSMGSSSGLVFNIAENTSVLKQLMSLAGIVFTTPAPTAVKKEFCGKGNAQKDVMCDEFAQRFGVSINHILGCVPYKSPENDLVDAVANLLMHPHFHKETT